MSTLELRGVSHRYPGGDRPSLDGVDVRVDDGAMVAVVGPSGSGKTTLLRVAAGLETPAAGTVLVDGGDVVGLPTEARDLTVMFQHPHLFDHLDVAGNVAFGPRVAGVRRRDARAAAGRYLRLVALEGYDRRPVASLSGGQQQRVALARALATERGALLLDEPFSSLDRSLRAAMHDLLVEVRAALNPTVLLVTHDLDEAALADSVVVLIDGAVHQQAPAGLLQRRPATLAVARLVGGFTEVPGRVVDGVHRSAWGAVPLPAGTAAGPATLLLRREALQVVEVPDAAPGDPGTAPAAVATARGRVVRRRRAGPRLLLGVVTADDTEVEVELPPGADVAAEAVVEVRLPASAAAWAVPSHAEPGGVDSPAAADL